MRRQRATIHAALSGRLLAVGRGFGFRLRRRARLGLLDVFKREQHLVFGKRLGAPTEAMTLQLLDDLNETLVADALGEQHRLQLVRIVGKRVDRLRHSRKKTIFSAVFRALRRPNSLCRRHPGSVGRRRLPRA